MIALAPAAGADRGIGMDESDRVMMRSYMDALNNYERINSEALAVARRKTGLSPGVHPVDRDSKPGIAANTARDVMLRWHAPHPRSRSPLASPNYTTTWDATCGRRVAA